LTASSICENNLEYLPGTCSREFRIRGNPVDNELKSPGTRFLGAFNIFGPELPTIGPLRLAIISSEMVALVPTGCDDNVGRRVIPLGLRSVHEDGSSRSPREIIHIAIKK
jgi:hypothetical protein